MKTCDYIKTQIFELDARFRKENGGFVDPSLNLRDKIYDNRNELIKMSTNWSLECQLILKDWIKTATKHKKQKENNKAFSKEIESLVNQLFEISNSWSLFTDLFRSNKYPNYIRTHANGTNIIRQALQMYTFISIARILTDRDETTVKHKIRKNITFGTVLFNVIDTTEYGIFLKKLKEIKHMAITKKLLKWRNRRIAHLDYHKEQLPKIIFSEIDILVQKMINLLNELSSSKISKTWLFEETFSQELSYLEKLVSSSIKK